MANVSRPKGFEPKGKPLRVNPYKSGGVIYPGDMVSSPSAGYVASSTGAAAELLLGAAMSYASASGLDVLVADHPAELYIAQAHSTAVTSVTAVGNYCSVYNGTGSSAYQLSRQEITSAASTVTLPLQIMAIDTNAQAGNNTVGDSVKVVVRINTHGS